jgi:AraC-like DNA-binding protein
VIHPFEVHTGSPAASGLRYRVVYPSGEWLQRVFPGSGAGLWPHFPSAIYRSPEAEALRHAIQVIGECSHPEPGQLAALSRVLAAIGERHSQGMRQCLDPGEADSQVGAACRLLSRTHADTAFEDAARMAGLSRYHFHRLFRRTVGLTPGGWSRSVRLRHARDLIQAGARLADVAYETGFADQSHLTREFKRVYGVTPGALSAA